MTDPDAIARAGAQLEEFYATLTPSDQAALRVVLRRARDAEGELTPGILRMRAAMAASA